MYYCLRMAPNESIALSGGPFFHAEQPLSFIAIHVSIEIFLVFRLHHK